MRSEKLTYRGKPVSTLDYLLAIMRDPSAAPERRDRAAICAACCRFNWQSMPLYHF
jgi:hypothetical protein